MSKTYEGEVEVRAETALLPRRVGPCQVGILRVGRAANNLDAERLKLRKGLVESQNLGGADKGEVLDSSAGGCTGARERGPTHHGVEEQDDPQGLSAMVPKGSPSHSPFAIEVRQLDVLKHALLHSCPCKLAAELSVGDIGQRGNVRGRLLNHGRHVGVACLRSMVL